MPEPIQVFEFEKITTSKGRHPKEGFTDDLYDAFRAYHRSNENTLFFELIDQGVRFKQYVGAIQIGKTTIEVLPKVGKKGSTKEWQDVLLSMLKKCHFLTAKKSGSANLKLKSNSILDLYFELYVNELETLLHAGLIKKYRRQKGQQRALKGSLSFPEHISKNLIHKERFYASHNVYDRDHLANQILYEALLLVDSISTNLSIKDKIGRLKLDYPEVSRLKVQATHFANLKNDRLLTHYREALEIAKLLLLNYRPDIKNGRENLLAIMFDMNVLWEEYIYRVLHNHKSGLWQVSRQNSTPFWASDRRSKSIRPDLVLENRKTSKTFVIDTKWKIIDSSEPSDDDLKQMYVYNHYWKAAKSMLLYPMNENQEDTKGKYSLQYNNQDIHCQLGFIRVLKGNELSNTIAEDLFEKINHSVSS
jgi:5-methylcytosine-specific restriction enzyme subunit McrC